MTQPPDPEARLARLEARVEDVADDAAAAWHLAAAHDRDIADLGVKVNACRAAINALGVQTAERFERLERRVGALETKVDEGFEQMHRGFAQMRHGFDQTAAGFARIAELISSGGNSRDDG
jgi:hypothetical protein